MKSAAATKSATKSPARRALAPQNSHSLYDRDCMVTRFTPANDHPCAEDYDGPVMMVSQFGDGELLCEALMLVEDARRYYADLRKKGWIVP